MALMCIVVVDDPYADNWISLMEGHNRHILVTDSATIAEDDGQLCTDDLTDFVLEHLKHWLDENASSPQALRAAQNTIIQFAENLKNERRS